MIKEFERTVLNGWSMFFVLLAALLVDVGLIVLAAWSAVIWVAVLLVLTGIVILVMFGGLFTLQPNEAAVLMLFGKYRGTSRREGLLWTHPFYSSIKVSLRARTLNMEKLKVNDQRGNPIEIAAVVVWHVADTAQASFDVNDCREYVSTQSETALRHLASGYPYDANHEHELSLRGSMDEVSQGLRKELQERLSKAGVAVDEARLSHLAYAPEIANAMLRRQQAEAVVAARTRIVEGAVGMVELALENLEKHKTISLDEERKAAMVSNLLVVLCGEQGAQAVVNTGSLYT
jgi:regulator of protease activity HflC (stomatin/prohibitin superfamily)